MTNQQQGFFNMFEKKNKVGDMAATLAETLIQARNESLRESLSDFENSEHKLEFVKTIGGIDFINDSRSTNINSVWFALESMTKPTTWIMNIAQLESITVDLLDIINEKVKLIVIQGVYNSAIYDFFSGLHKKVVFSMNLEDAVRSAYYSSQPGNAILFSPGTVSAGAYRTYRERGEKFKDAVAQL